MSKALQVISKAPFALSKPPALPPALKGIHALENPEQFVQLTQQMLESPDTTEFDLKRFRVGRGGSTSWTYIKFGEEQTAKELEGVILAIGNRRAFYEKGFGQGGDGAPPDCSSADGITGYGVLPDSALKAFKGGAVKAEDGKTGGAGFNCYDCPFSQWESAVNDDGSPGRGQRCKAARAVYFLESGDNVPSVIVLPPASLGNAKKFVASFIQEGLPLFAVRVKASLEKSVSGGYPHARAVFKMAGKDLKAAQVERDSPWFLFLAQVSEFVKATMLPQFSIQAEDVSGGGD